MEQDNLQISFEKLIVRAIADTVLIYESVQWKDFLLWFKRNYVPNTHTKEVSKHLRVLLNIDQNRDIKSGVEYTHHQWLSLSTFHS